MQWTADGQRLVTGDAQGTVCVWAAQGGLNPALLAQYRDPGSCVDHLVLSDPASAPPEFDEDGAGSEAEPLALAVYAVYAGERDETRVFAANDQENRMSLFKFPGRCKALHWLPGPRQVVVVDAAGMLSTWGREPDGWAKASSMLTPGLGRAGAGGAGDFRCVWCGDHTLAIASPHEASVRMYDAGTQDNFKLELPGSARSEGLAASITALAVTEGGVLAAGTNTGAVVVWKHKPRGGGRRGSQDGAGAAGAAVARDPEEDWQLQVTHHFSARVDAVHMGPHGRSMAVQTAGGVVLSRGSLPRSSMGYGLACVQTSDTGLSIDSDKGGHGMEIETAIQIHGVSHHKDKVLVWSGEEAQIYTLTSSGPQLTASFPRAATSMAVAKDVVFECSPAGVNLLDLEGTARMTLPSEHVHGPPVCLDLRADVLAIVTREGFVDIYRTGTGTQNADGGRPVSLGPPRRLNLNGTSVGVVESCRLNRDGTMLSLLTADRSAAAAHPPGRVFVYDIAEDSLAAHDLPGRSVLSHAWDARDERLLGVETEPSADDDRAGARAAPERQVSLLFASQGAIHHFDTADMDPDESLLGLRAPNVSVFARPDPVQGDAGGPGLAGTLRGTMNGGTLKGTLKGTSQRDMGVVTEGGRVKPRIKQQRMSPFSGLDDGEDEGLVTALLGFSFYTAAGNKEEAFKVAKGIDDASVWESLAQMCIKTRRLDVAEHCLSNMGHLQGARALREARDVEDVNVRVALVALHLGLQEDAEQLLAGAEAWGQLGALLVASGEWDKALALAESRDRLHLRSTRFAHARFLEERGDIPAAMREYELAGAHATEVPRMLLKAGEAQRLEEYVMVSQDRDLLAWWARLCESQGNLATALRVYEMAGNHAAAVKLHCMQGMLEQAEALVENTRDPAAAFQLAMQFESMASLEEDPRPLYDEAMRFFVQADRPAYALRLALKMGDEAQVMQLAGKCAKSDQLHAAQLLEAAGELDQAVRLYQLGGHQSKALELCFKLGRYDALEQIAAELDTGSDPGILLRCAHFLVENGQAGRAMRYFAMAGEVERALEMAEDGVPGAVIDEEVAEVLTPAKGQGDPVYRERVLLRVAEACMRQGQFHLACKKFTQAGDKRRGMRALLRSGDKDKIVFFAGVSRDREVYRMAANFLQALDWRNDRDVTKNIIGFYTKAKDYASLAAFYESCAQMEIDEYRDYDKALAAMRNAGRYLDKAGPDHALAKATLAEREELVGRYLRARAVLAPDAGAIAEGLGPEQEAAAERVCHQLLHDAPQEVAPQEASIRIGDVFALLVEYKHARGELGQAHALLVQMRDRGLVLAPYIDGRVLDDVFSAGGVVDDGSGARGAPAARGPGDAHSDANDDIPADVDDTVDSDGSY